MSAKKTLLAITAGIAAGAILGILYAPEEGCITRRKLQKLKSKFSSCGCNEYDELEELKEMLQEELDRVNKRLDNI